MSYQEKKTVTSILTGLFLLIAYCVYASGQYNSGAAAPDDLKVWAGMMLTFIGIGIAVNIVVLIVFHILFSISIAMEKKIRNENCDDGEIEKSINLEIIEDERDKIIELKAMKFGFIVAGVGFVGALVSLILNYPPMVMLNIMYVCFFVGSLFEGVGQLYYYRKGV